MYGVDPDDVITLRLRSSPPGDEILFKFRRGTKMQKIFNAYASKRGIDEQSLRFVIDGERISPHSTAEMLDLEDNDVVDVFTTTDNSSSSDSGLGREQTSSKQKQFESMKSVIINELEENVSSSLSVTPLSNTDDTLELCGDRDNIMTSDVLHVAALYGVDERFTNYEAKPIASTSGAGGGKDRDRDKDGLVRPTEGEFERALSNIEPLVQALKDWEYVGSSGGSSVDPSDLADLSSKERMMALKVPSEGMAALLGPLKGTRPGLYKALSSHPLVCGVNSSRQRDRRAKERERERQRQKDKERKREKERERGGISSREPKESSAASVTSTLSSPDNGSEPNSAAVSPAPPTGSDETVGSSEFQKKVLLSLISKAIAEGTSQGVLFAVLMLYRAREEKWLSVACPVATESQPVSSTTDREVEELTACAESSGEGVLGGGDPETLPVGALISTLFEGLRVSSSSPDLGTDKASSEFAAASDAKQSLNPFVWNDSYARSLSSQRTLFDDYGRCSSLGASDGGLSPSTSYTGTTATHYAHTSDAGSISCGLSDAGSLFGGSMFAEGGTETASINDAQADHMNAENDSVSSGTGARNKSPDADEAEQEAQRILAEQEQEQDDEDEEDEDEEDEDEEDEDEEDEDEEDEDEEDEDEMLAQALALSMQSVHESSTSGADASSVAAGEDGSAPPESANPAGWADDDSSDTWRSSAPSQFKLAASSSASASTAKNVRMMEQQMRGQQRQLSFKTPVSYPEVPIMSALAPLVQSAYMKSLYSLNLFKPEGNYQCYEELSEVSFMHIIIALLAYVSASADTAPRDDDICSSGKTLELSKDHKLAMLPSATTLMLLEVLLDLFVNEFRLYNENLADSDAKKLDRVGFSDMIAKLKVRASTSASASDAGDAPAPSPWQPNCDAGEFTPYIYSWIISTLLKLLKANLSCALDTRMPLSNIGMHKSSAHVLIDRAIGAMAASTDIVAYLDRSRLLATDAEFLSPSVLPLPYLVERAIMACGGCMDVSRGKHEASCALLDSIAVASAPPMTVFSPVFYRHILKIVSMDAYAIGFAMFYPTIKERELRLQIMLHSTPNSAESGALRAGILWSVNDFRPSNAQNNLDAMLGCIADAADPSLRLTYYQLYKLQRCCLAACKWNLLRCHSISRSGGGGRDAEDGRGSSGDAGRDVPVSDRWSHILANSAPSDSLSRCSVGVGAASSDSSIARPTSSAPSLGSKDTDKRVMLEYLRNILPSGMVAHDSALERLCGALVGDDSTKKASESLARSAADEAGLGASSSANDPTLMTPTASSSDLLMTVEAATIGEGSDESGGNAVPGASGVGLATQLPSVLQLLLERLEHADITTTSSAVSLSDGTCSVAVPSSRFLFYGELSLLKLYQLRHNLLFINSCASSSMLGTRALKKMFWNPVNSSPLEVSEVDGASTVHHLGPKHWHTAFAEAGFSPNSGVYEWGIRVNKCDKNHVFAGVCFRDTDRTTYIGGNSQSWGLIGTKALWHSRMKVRTDYGDGFGTDSTVYVRLDTNCRTLSFSTDNSDWGVAFEGLPSTILYPAVSLYQRGDSVSIFNVSAPPLSTNEVQVAAGNEYLNDYMARCVVQADFIAHAHKIIQSVCKIVDAVDAVGSSVSTDDLEHQQKLLAHPLITVLLPSLCAAIAVSHMKREHGGFSSFQLLPHLLVLSKRLAGLHEKYFNSSLEAAVAKDFKSACQSQNAEPVTNTNVASCINGGWWMKSSSNISSGRGGTHVPPQQYYIDLSCSRMSASDSADANGNDVSADIVGADSAFIVSGSGGIPVESGGLSASKKNDGGNLVTVDGALVGTRMKFVETWSGGSGTCAVEGRVSLDGGYFVGRYRDCSNRNLQGNIEGFRVSGASKVLRPNLLLKSAYLVTLACGKLIGSLVVGLSSVALDDALFASPPAPAVDEAASPVCEDEEDEEEESKEDRPPADLQLHDAEVENRRMGHEEDGSLTVDESKSPSPEPAASVSNQRIVVLHEDEVKWLRSDLLSGGLPLTPEVLQYLYKEIIARTSLSKFTDLIVSGANGAKVNDIATLQPTAPATSPVVLWWLLRVFPSLAPVIRNHHDLGEALAAGTELIPAMSAFGATRSLFLSSHIVDRKAPPGATNPASSVMLDDYVTHHVGQSMFLKLGGGQVFQAARRLVLAALIKHSGCVSLCRAEYDALVDGSREQEERPCELIIEIWRATLRVIEYWIPQKAVLKLTFAEIAAIVSSRASFLLELEPCVASQRLEDNLSMIPIAMISVNSELRKQPVGVTLGSMDASVSVREIEKEGSKLLTDAASFLMCSSTQDVSPLRTEMLKASLRSVSRTAGLKSFMLLYSSKVDDCPSFDNADSVSGKSRLWASSQLPPLSSLLLQPLAAQYIIFALHGVNDIDAWKRAQASAAPASTAGSSKPSGGSVAASASKTAPGAAAPIPSAAQLMEKRKQQQKLLSECSGHYSDGLKGCSISLGDEVKQSFDIAYEHITQLLQRCIWGADKDGQCITLACWGLTIHPHDHLFLNRVGIFRTLQSVLDESRSTLSKYRNADSGTGGPARVVARNIIPSALYINSVKRLSQLVLKVVHSLASQVAFTPEKANEPTLSEKRASASPLAPLSPVGGVGGIGAESGSFRLQRLPSGPDTLSSSLFDLLYSELFSSMKHVIMLTIKSKAQTATSDEGVTAESALTPTPGAALPVPAEKVVDDAEAAARETRLTIAANISVLGARSPSSTGSSDGFSSFSSQCPGTGGAPETKDDGDDEDLLGEQYIYRMLRLLHSVANSVICQKILCSPKWLSLLIAGVGCGGLGIQRRLLKLLRRLLVLSDVKNVKAFVSSLFSERDEFICSDTALDEEDVEALIWSQENYSAENDAFLCAGAGVNAEKTEETTENNGFDYWSQAKTASERIVVMLLEGASVILPTSVGLLDVNCLCNHLHTNGLCNTLSSEAMSFLRVLQGSPDWRAVVETVMHRYMRSALTATGDEASSDGAVKASMPFEHADDELKLRMVAMSLAVYGGFIDGFHIGGLVNLRPFGLVGVAESFSLKLAAISHSCGMLVGQGPNHVDVVLMEQGIMYSSVKDNISGENRNIVQHSTSMPATLPVKPVRMSVGDIYHTNDVTPIPEFISETIFDDIVALLVGSCMPTISEQIKNVKIGAAVAPSAEPVMAESAVQQVSGSRQSARRRLIDEDDDDECDEEDEDEGEWGYDDGEEDNECMMFGGEDDEMDIVEEEEGSYASEFGGADLNRGGDLESDLFRLADLGAPVPAAAAVSALVVDPIPVTRKRSSSKSSSRAGGKAATSDGTDDTSVLQALKLLTSTYCFRAFSNSMQSISLIKVFFRKYPELLPQLLSMAAATSSCGGASVVEQVEQRWVQLWDAYVLLNHNAETMTPDALGPTSASLDNSGAAEKSAVAPSLSRGSSAEHRPSTANGGSAMPPLPVPPAAGGLDRSPPASQFLRREPSVPVLPPFMQAAPPIAAPAMRQADPDMVAQMMEMGLQQNWCEFALRRCRNNIEMAINLCFEQSGEMDQLIAEEAAMTAQMQARSRARAAEAASASSGSTTYRRAGAGSGASPSESTEGQSGAARIASLFSRVMQHRTRSSGGGDASSSDTYSTPPSVGERSGLGSSDAGSLMTHLMELGFPPHWCLRALAASGNDADAALSWIASHGDELVAEAEGSGRDGMDLEGLAGLIGSSAGVNAGTSGSTVSADIAAELPEGPTTTVPRGPNPLICVSGSCTIDDELNCLLQNSMGGFPSVGCRGFPVSSGKWYYELVLKTAGCIQLGWVDLAYIGGADAGEGVGDDCHSWAYDGWRVYAWHERSMDWGAAWTAGDVVGCAIDLDNNTISFYLNGYGEEVRMGVAYRNIQFSGGVYPCVSFNRNETVQFNFGSTPFRHPPPEGYSPYIEHVREGVGKARTLAEDLDRFFVNLTESLASADINSKLPQDLAVIAEAKGKDSGSGDSSVSAATGEDLGELNNVYRYMYEDAMDECRGETNFPVGSRYFPQDEGGNARLMGGSGSNDRTLRFPAAILPTEGVPALAGAGSNGTYTSVAECREAILAQFAQLSKDLCILYCRISLLRAFGSFALVGCPSSFTRQLTVCSPTTVGADTAASAEQTKVQKKTVSELLYLLRLSSMYTGRTRVFLHTMSLLPSTSAVPANLGSVCCAGGAPTLHVLKDSLQAALHHLREDSGFADAELVEQMLANIRLDTLRATRREYMNDYKIDNGLVAYCVARNGGGVQGHGGYHSQHRSSGGNGTAPDIDCLTLPDLSLATFLTVVLMEQFAVEATLLESGAAGHVKTHGDAHREFIVKWMTALVECWCRTLMSPSMTVKLCANRMLSVLVQEVSSPGSRFGEVDAQYCGDDEGGRGASASIAHELCNRLSVIVPLERLEKLAVDRLAVERGSMPICSEYLQSVAELAVCCRNMVNMCGGESSVKASAMDDGIRAPSSAEESNDSVPGFSWEANDGRVFSDDGWTMWTGTVKQLGADWSGSSRSPSPSSWVDHGRQDRAPTLLPGCYVISKKKIPAFTAPALGVHPTASALKDAISDLDPTVPNFTPAAPSIDTTTTTAAAAESGGESDGAGAGAFTSVPSAQPSPAPLGQEGEPFSLSQTETTERRNSDSRVSAEDEEDDDEEDEDEEDEDEEDDDGEDDEDHEHDADAESALEEAQQSIFEQMVAVINSPSDTGGSDGAQKKEESSSRSPDKSCEPYAEHRRGIVVGVTNWKGDTGGGTSVGAVDIDPELLRVCNGNARVIRWEGQEETEVVRWGADEEFDVTHVCIDKRKQHAALSNPNPTHTHTPPDASVDVLFPPNAIVKKYPPPVTAKQRASNRLFATEQTFGVILRLREIPFVPKPIQEVCETSATDEDEGIVAKYDGILEWPDFNTIVYVTARKHAGKLAELEVTERRLLTPSEGNTCWTVRFGVDKWTPTTFYLTPPNTAVAGGTTDSSPARRTADNKNLGSEYLGQFSYVSRVGETQPQEKVVVTGTMELQQSSLFCFDEKLKNKAYSVSHEKMMVSNAPGGGRGLVFGSVGFSVGVHYWEFKIEHADIGSIFLGVCEKPPNPGVGFTSHMQQSCSKWFGAGYINHRTSFKRSINASSTERSAVYGDHFQIGDTVGVLLDMNRGKLYFFLDGMKYGEHIIQDLGEAFDNLTNSLSVHRKVYYPVVGFQKSQDRVVITPRWLSSIGTNVHADFQLIGKAAKLLTTWSLERRTSKPLASDMWVYRDSWRDWRRWISGRYMRVKSRCNAATMLVSVDTLPLSCVEASIGLGLHNALFHGDRIIFTKSCGRSLDTKEEGVILGAYRKKLWYRLDNQTSGETVTEGGGLAWCLADCDIEGLQLVRRASGERNLGLVCNILLPRLPEHNGGRISICYSGGAVMRDGLEIDAADTICTIPADSVLFATEKRVNSSNIVRYHVVYEQHYGWISERMRGGKEDLMVSVLRNSTAEELSAVKAEAKGVLDRFYSKVASPASPALPESEAAATGGEVDTAGGAAAGDTPANPYTNVDWETVDCLEEAMEVYIRSVRRQCSEADQLLGVGGVLCDGCLPSVELDYLRTHSGSGKQTENLSSFADAVPGYSYQAFVELSSKMTGGAAACNWTVEADMQLAELLTRCANRERVTPQNLSCFALEKSLRLLDLSVAFPALKDVPARRLLARASVMRVANQVLEYTLPYFASTLPEEKWLCNRRGSEDELLVGSRVPGAVAVATTPSERKHLHSDAGSCTCSTSTNAALYNSVDYGRICDTAASNRLDKFPDDIGIERKLRDVTEVWRPVCGARKLRSLRRLIFSYTKRAFWESICDATATATPLPQDEYEDPQQIKTLKLNRIKATVPTLAALPSAHDRIKQSIFGQLHRELRNWNNSSFRRAYISKGHGGQKRAFKVKFLGEGVNDYGGPYRAVFESIVDELQSDGAIVGRKISERTLLPLLVPCPNRSSGVSSNQDKYLLSPAPTSPLTQELMQFLGKLIGMAVRHNITLGLTASTLLWRPLVKQSLGKFHLETVDTLISNQVSEVEKLGLELEEKARVSGAALADNFQPEEWRDLVFATYLSDGTRLPLIPRGEDVGVTMSNWKQYVAFVERARLREGALMFKVLRDGLSTVLPTELLPLFTAVELEQLICGNSTVDVQLLQQCTEYEDGLTPDTQLVVNFWEILTEMSNEERTLFLRFVWARSRMPASLSELSMNFKLQLASHGGTDDTDSNPDSYLPSAQTCFFSLALPKYSCKEVLKQKLLYAIENSPNMDADVRMHSAEGWDA